MPSSNVQAAIENWKNRIATWNQLGIPTEKYQGLMQQDLTKVIGEDATPMSNTEANVALLPFLQQGGGGTGSVIGNPTPHPTNIGGDISEAVTSVPSDIKDILSNFISGTVNLVHHAPSELTNLGGLITNMGNQQYLADHGYDTSGGLGADLRNDSSSCSIR